MAGRHDEVAVAAAVERLMAGERLRDAEAAVVRAAPDLQRVLVEALAGGGWFEDSHRAEVDRVAAVGDPHERATALATLLAEETRIAMMVGVTVGWAIADELEQTDHPNEEE